MSNHRTFWLFTLAVTAAALYLTGVMTLSALSELWSDYGRLPYGFEQIQEFIGLGPAAIQALMVLPAVLIGWIAARLAFNILSLPWLLASLGVILLILPLLIGYQHNGTWRWIALSSWAHWYPGPWALLLLTPILVDLSQSWRQTHRSRFILAHMTISAFGLTLFGMQSDSMMVLLFAILVAHTMLSRPIAGLLSLCLTGAIVIVLWTAFAPISFGFMHWLYRSSMHDAMSCGFFPTEPNIGYIVWQAADWIGSSVDLASLNANAPTSSWIFFIENIAQDWALTAIAGLFGRAAVLSIVIISILFGVSLIQIAANHELSESQLPCHSIRLWGLLVLAMVTATAFNSIGYEAPSLAIPFVSFGLNLTLAMSFVAGSALGIAYNGKVRLPLVDAFVTRVEVYLQQLESNLRKTAVRLFSSAEGPT